LSHTAASRDISARANVDFPAPGAPQTRISACGLSTSFATALLRPHHREHLVDAHENIALPGLDGNAGAD